MLFGQNWSKNIILFTLGFFLLATSFSFAAEEAGTVTKIIGEVIRSSADGMDEEELSEGSTVYSGDSIRTGKKGFVRLVFKDKTIVNLSKKTKFLIRKFDYDPSTNKRETIYGLVKGQMRSLIQEKTKENQNVKFLGKTISLGVRGTTILANAYKAAKVPVNDVAITKGKVVAKTAAGKSFEVAGGQFVSSSTYATKGVQTMSAAALKALESTGAFLPNLIGPNGAPIPLDQALKSTAAVGAAAGALAGAATGLIAGAISSDDDKKEEAPKKEEKKEPAKKVEEKKEEAPKEEKFSGSYLPTHNGIELDLTKEPEDIRWVIQNYAELKSDYQCFYWFYKALPGGGKKERFRRKRKCHEFENDLD